MALLSLEHVNKWHGNRQVLRDVCLEVQPGERLVICGPSGSGKSTLLRCINALAPHESGRILVDGVELTDDAKSLEAVRREVGMVFQSFNLFPHLTVLENCTLAPIWALRMPRETAQATALRELVRVRIEGLAAKFPSELSGGEQQRVAIARALCMSPKLMLFDEPTSALDPEMIQEVLDAIVTLADAGTTMICVTHEMGFARRVADRIAFIDHGAIIESGTPQQIFDAPQSPRLKLFLSRILREQPG
jgi:general L-amino acid transport system ATP-binding protein